MPNCREWPCESNAEIDGYCWYHRKDTPKYCAWGTCALTPIAGDYCVRHGLMIKAGMTRCVRGGCDEPGSPLCTEHAQAYSCQFPFCPREGNVDLMGVRFCMEHAAKGREFYRGTTISVDPAKVGADRTVITEVGPDGVVRELKRL